MSVQVLRVRLYTARTAHPGGGTHGDRECAWLPVAAWLAYTVLTYFQCPVNLPCLFRLPLNMKSFRLSLKVIVLICILRISLTYLGRKPSKRAVAGQHGCDQSGSWAEARRSLRQPAARSG